MLEQAFQDVYTKFKLHFYQNVFQHQAHQLFLPVIPKLLPAHDLEQGRIDLPLFCILF